jgi:hypothetical protein
MSEEGISGCFVNSHSFVHDIVTLSAVRTLRSCCGLSAAPCWQGRQAAF